MVDEIPMLTADGPGRRAHKRAIRRLPKVQAIRALLPLAEAALERAAGRPGATNQSDRFRSIGESLAWARSLQVELTSFEDERHQLSVVPAPQRHSYLAGKPAQINAALEATTELHDAARASHGFDKHVISAALNLIRSGTPVELVDAALRKAYSRKRSGGEADS